MKRTTTIPELADKIIFDYLEHYSLLSDAAESHLHDCITDALDMALSDSDLTHLATNAAPQAVENRKEAGEVSPSPAAAAPIPCARCGGPCVDENNE